jgi:midasin (ATPase involved in ribosome maturation)
MAEAVRLRDKIQTFITHSIQTFVFKEVPLLRMMGIGGWLLLEAVDAASQEAKRLRSLLEEDPSLAIYEGVPPLLLHGKGS